MLKQDNDSIELLGLRERTKKVLRDAGYIRISDIKSKSDNELLKCPNIGRVGFNEVKDKLATFCDKKQYTLRTKEFAERNAVKPTSILQRFSDHGHYFGITPLKLANGRLLWPDAAVENEYFNQGIQKDHGANTFRERVLSLRKDAKIGFETVSNLFYDAKNMRDVLLLVKEILVSEDQKRNSFRGCDWCDLLELAVRRALQIK